MAYATEWRHLSFDELSQRVYASVEKTGELPSTYIGNGAPQWLYICIVRRRDYVKVPYAPVARYLTEHHRNASEVFYTWANLEALPLSRRLLAVSSLFRRRSFAGRFNRMPPKS